MKKYYDVLRECVLFKGINEADFEHLLGCLNPKVNKYHKGETIFLAGDHAKGIAIIVSGRVQIYIDDIFGNRSIVAELTKKDLFSEAVPFTKANILPLSSLAITDTEIMFIEKDMILCSCATVCSFHKKLIENLLVIISEKNLILSKKTEHISKRTIRSKILSYLSDFNAANGKKEFSIPFDRQELADYLCVDRSALSAELSKLRDEGIIEFRKNNFRLLL